MHSHTNGADSARPKNGMHTRRKYGLLVPTEPADDTASAGTQLSGDCHEATRGASKQAHMATETGDRTGQRALLVRAPSARHEGGRR